MDQIENAIKELKCLNTAQGTTMHKISWWLLKNEDLFQNSLKEIPFGELPSSIELSSLEFKFRFLYEDLISLERLKSKEIIFRERLKVYRSLKNDSVKFNDWIKLNKEEALGSHFDLWFEWTDHNPDQIRPFFLYWEHLNISIPISEFKYTLKVLEIFHDHYWYE